MVPELNEFDVLERQNSGNGYVIAEIRFEVMLEKIDQHRSTAYIWYSSDPISCMLVRHILKKTRGKWGTVIPCRNRHGEIGYRKSDYVRPPTGTGEIGGLLVA